MFTALHNFCAVDLSAFYFDVRKDALYCDAPASLRRRAVRTVMNELFSCLTAWLAPVLCFTAEEAWLNRGGAVPADRAESVHLRLFPAVPEAWRDEALAAKWEKVRAVRRVVTGALEKERAEKVIGSSLQAAPTVYIDDRDLDRKRAVQEVDFAEICITSAINIQDFEPSIRHQGPVFMLEDVPGVVVGFDKAPGQRCERCWRVLPEVGQHGALCRRCESVVGDAARAAD